MATSLDDGDFPRIFHVVPDFGEVLARMAVADFCWHRDVRLDLYRNVVHIFLGVKLQRVGAVVRLKAEPILPAAGRLAVGWPAGPEKRAAGATAAS